MRLYSFLPLAAIGTAFVIPDQETFSALKIKKTETSSRHEVWDSAKDSISTAFNCAKNVWEATVNQAEDMTIRFKDNLEEAFSNEFWLHSEEYDTDLFDRPPHHGPPHHGPPHHGPPHHGGPHKPPHHGKPNRTVYELISESKYTTKLAKLISDDDELVQLLNGTTANFTLFAPIDSAFEHIPEDHEKPSKEFIRKLLTYHVSPDFYPAGRILVSRTIPTAFDSEYIGGEPQRLSTQISLRGLTVNFYARVVAVNIFGTNGVIHGIDSILVPPPKAADILSFLPGKFSTLELGLIKTGLLPELNDTSKHVGGTLFAPSNFAFELLGPKVNAFLFSKYGEKYLKALLEYHVVANYTLYSDAFYKASSAEDVETRHDIPKGLFHVDLPTLLEDRPLSIDVARYGRLISIRINGFTRVAIADGIAADGVIHVVPNVLLPPKSLGGPPVNAEGMSVEELKAALAPYVKDDGGVEDSSEDWSVEL